MLLAPFLRKWTYTRSLEQISGGHKFLPPRQDVNAPDLYVPFMAAWTYCILVGIASLASGKFKPDIVYNTVSSCKLLCTTITFKHFTIQSELLHMPSMACAWRCVLFVFCLLVICVTINCDLIVGKWDFSGMVATHFIAEDYIECSGY